MLLIAIVINIAFFYGMAARPEVFFHLSTPLNYDETIDFSSGDLEVEFIAENRGSSAARVWLVVTFYNMSSTSHEGSTVSEGEASVLRVPLDLPPHQANSFSATFNSVGAADYMVLILSVEVSADAGPAIRFGDSFAIFNPVRPTALLLKQTEGSNYKRVTSR